MKRQFDIVNYETPVRYGQLMGRISPHDANDLSPDGAITSQAGVQPLCGNVVRRRNPEGVARDDAAHGQTKKAPASGHKKRGQPERIDPEDGGDLLSHYTQYHRRRRA